MNPYFKTQPDSALFDDDAFASARAAFFESRDRFVDRLMCAQFFDADRFDAIILWLDELKRFHDATAEPMLPGYFEHADSIINHLEIQSRYSATQKDACIAAAVRWRAVLKAFAVRT